MLPQPDTREQERVEREAEAARRAEQEAEERRRQEQVDLTERKRQEEAEKQRRLAEQQAKQKEIADRLAKIRAERAKAEKAERLAEQKLQQLKDAQARSQESRASESTASPPPGSDGADPNLIARYKSALNAAIVQNWTRPETVPIGQRCKIVIRQVPGGTVIDAKVDPSCPYDALGRRSIEAAVLKAAPLPYAGFEPVFNRTLILTCEASDR
jgi:colicin import membrane protein